ncbi:MAG: TorF family putative porin, partial [Rhizobacter sp.]
MLKKSLLLLAVVGATLPAVSHAEEASPLSFNLGAVTDYRYRGIAQTRFEPALQGGIDLALPAGFYIGTWGSTVKWIKDSGGDASAEVDVYAGWKKEVVSGLTLDVGVLQYLYPEAKTPAWDAAYASPDTLEVYTAVTFGPATVKYSHAVTNLFGNRDSKGSGYLDLSAGFEVAGLTLTPHVGYQKVKGYTNTLSYTDYSFTVSKDISGTVVSLA